MKKLMEDLRRYRERYPEETEKADRLIKIVETESDLLGKVNKDGHLTGSAWIMNREKTHVLLTHHAKLNIWIQLGGHTEEGESVYDTAFREAVEESELKSIEKTDREIFDIDIHLIPARKNEKEHYHYDIRYVFYVDMDEEFTVTDESHDLKWVELGKVEGYTKEESILRMVRKSKDSKE